MSTVLDPDKVLRIDEDIIKPQLQTAAASGSYSLSDPNSSTRPSNSRFILTSYPSRPNRYPYVVIEVLSASGGRIDKRQTLFEETITIRFSVRGKIKTHCHNIINGISEVMKRDWQTLAESGLNEIEITGASNVTWDTGNKIYGRTMTIQCIVYSMYSP